MTNDQIEQFKQFMEFVQNVDKYKQVIIELQKTTKKNDDAYTTLSQGQTLAAWQVKLDAAKTKFANDSRDAQESFDKQTAATIYKLVSKESALGEREAELTQKERDLNERENQIRVNEADINNQLNDVEITQTQLAARETALQQREVALIEKTNQIQKLVG